MSPVLDIPFAPPPTILERFHDQHGRTLQQLSDSQPVLVVFLRHSGCTFCREAVADLVREQNQRNELHESAQRLNKRKTMMSNAAV